MGLIMFFAGRGANAAIGYGSAPLAVGFAVFIMIIETFVAPMVGHEAMKHLESGGMGAVNALLGGFYLGGTIALGWAARKAKLRPRWAGPALAISAVVLVAVMSSTSKAAGVVIIVATMMYGISLAALAAMPQRPPHGEASTTT